MREENLDRLNTTDISADNLNYLHYVSYHAALFTAIANNTTGELLDIGCGNKPYKHKLEPLVTKYVGCDIVQSSERCVDVVSPANNIPLDSETFDTVLSTQTIEHVEDHQGLVNEAYRLLRSGGKFILSGPLYWPLHEEPYDFFRFTRYGFEYVLKKAGFEIVSIEANGGKWSVAGQAFMHALYPDIYFMKGFKGRMLRRLIKRIGGPAGLNNFFLKLDKKSGPDVSNTMNYVIVAQKPRS